MVWLAEQLFTSLSLSLSPPLLLALSLFCFVFCRDDRGKALLLRVCIDRGPSKGGGGGTSRAGPFATTAAASAPSPSTLPIYPLTPFSSCLSQTLLLSAHSEIQIQGSYSQRLGEGEHEKSKREMERLNEIEMRRLASSPDGGSEWSWDLISRAHKYKQEKKSRNNGKKKNG